MGLNRFDALVKRTFDLTVAIVGLVILGWLILISAAIAALDTGRNGFFVQRRVGYRGRLFNVIKLRTMRDRPGVSTTVTADGDVRITRLGRILRKLKLDELPQLINVLLGQMSLVGPRPDVPGFADQLTGEDRVVLSVRPGITGPATLKYRNEEALLAAQDDPERYNAEVIYPDKVSINKRYIKDWSLGGDLAYIWRTVVRD